MKRRHALGAAVITIALGLGVLAWQGPGRAFIRGFSGDVLAAACVFFLITAALPRWRPGPRATSAALVCVAVEVGQATGWVGPGSPPLLRLVFGATFDGWDFAAYALGVALAAVVARAACSTAAAERTMPSVNGGIDDEQAAARDAAARRVGGL